MRELIIDGEEIVLDDSGNLVSRKAVVEPQVDSAKGTSGDVPFISPMGISYASTEAAREDRSGTLDMAKGLIKTIPDTVVAIPELMALGLDLAAGTRIAPTARREYEEFLASIGLLPETEYGEVANLVGVFGTSLIGGIRYANAATRAAQNQKMLDTMADVAAVRGVSPASVRQVDDLVGAKEVISRGASPITGLGTTRKKIPVGTSILPMIMPAERLGRSKIGQKLLAGEGFKGNLGRALATSGSVAVADFTMAPDGVGTISDAFDSAPNFMKTEDAYDFAKEDFGFTGRDEALRRLRNKLRIAGEGALISGGFDLALTGVSPLAKKAAPVAKGVKTGVQVAARTGDLVTGQIISRGFNRLIESAGNTRLGGLAKRKLTTSRGLREDIFEDISDLGNVITDSDRDMATQLALFGKATETTVGKMAPLGIGRRANQAAYIDLEDYLTGQIPLAEIQTKHGATAAKAAQRMKNERDKLSTMLFDYIKRQKDDGLIDDAVAAELVDAFEKLEGQYLQRSFSAGIARKDMGKFKALPDFARATDEVLRAMEGIGEPEFIALNSAQKREFAEDYVAKQIALERFENPDAAKAVPNKLAAAQADNLNKGRDVAENVKKRVPLYALSEQFLKSRSVVLDKSETLRALMGEVTARGYGAPGTLPYVSPEAKKLIQKPKLTAQEALTLRLTDTISDMSRATATIGFYRELLNDPVLAKNYAEITAGETPYIIKGVDPKNRAAIEAVQNAGYVKVPDASNTVFGGSYGDLAGTFVKPEFFQAITQPTRLDTLPGHIIDSLIQLKGLSQASKTVLSLATQARNFHSIPFFLASNGNILRGASLEDSVLLAANKVLNFSDDDFNEFMKYLGRSGVLDSGPVLQEQQAMLGYIRKEMRDPDVKRRGLARLTEMTGEQIAKLPGGSQVLDAAASPFKAATRAYRFSDNLTRIASLLAERGKYAAALRNPLNDVLGVGAVTSDVYDLLMPAMYGQGLTKRLGSRAIEQGPTVGPYRGNFDIMMGDIVGDTVPNYGRTYELAQDIARFPLAGNFVAYAAENIRNSVNIFNQGFAELSFKKTPELLDGFRQVIAKQNIDLQGLSDEAVEAAIRAGEYDDLANKLADKFVNEINAIGVRRLGGYIGSTQVMGRSTARAINGASGNNEEQAEALRELAADYYKGSNLAILFNDNEGLVEFTNLSTNLPYDGAPLVGESAMAALRTFARNKEQLGEGNFVSTNRALADFLIRNLSQFGNEAILSERIFDVFLRNGQTRQGRIFAPDLTYGEKMEAGLPHIFGALNPTIVNEFMSVNAKGIGPGRLTAAAKGQTFTGGTVPELQKEFFRLVFGLTPHKMNVPLQVAYEMAEYNRTESNIRRDAYRSLRVSRPAATIGDFEQDVLDAQARLFRLQQDKYVKLRAAGILGVDYYDAQDALDAQNITLSQGEFDAIQEGRFFPLDLNPDREYDAEVQTEVFNLKREIDPEILGESIDRFNGFSQNEFEDLPLTEPFPFRDETVEEIFGSEVSSKINQNPAPELALSSPEASVAPAPVPPVQAAGPISPGLLGDNPVEVARNMELAQRTRRNV